MGLFVHGQSYTRALTTLDLSTQNSFEFFFFFCKKTNTIKYTWHLPQPRVARVQCNYNEKIAVNFESVLYLSEINKVFY